MTKRNQGSHRHGQSDMLGVQGAEVNFRDQLTFPDEWHVGESNDVSEFELDLDQIEAKLFDDMDKAHEGINNPNAAGAPISPDLKAATFAEV